MPILVVTGGSGYVGNELVRQLARAYPDAELRILDNLQRGTHQALFDLPHGPRYRLVQGDLLDPHRTRRALEGADVVFHLAGIVRTPVSFDHPTWMHQINHWGTHHLAQAAREASVARFVHASSCAIYGPSDTPQTPANETTEPKPLGPYAESKLAAEHAATGLLKGATHLAIVRLGTVYGLAPAMRFDSAPNRMLLDAATQRSLQVHGSGQQRRPIVHVTDAANALLHAAHLLQDQKPRTGQTGATNPAEPLVVNAVAANPTMTELAASIQQADPDIRIRYTDQDVANRLTFAADASRLRALGWAPRSDHQQAIRTFLERFEGFREDAAGPVGPTGED